MLSLFPCRWRGLISGVSAIKETDPRIEVIGVEAEETRSMKAAFEARRGPDQITKKLISLQTLELPYKGGTVWPMK